ncbi:hypothetical protein [Nocardia alni]|uniref:hypothetical protein n=1 Tax=Nocardia alni TaxID=2815723 RepID=UPI001C21765E|nr:hypothetical protein [Nocardia alni]
MALETIERRLSDIGRRTDRLESKVRDMDTGYGTVTYHLERDMLGVKAMLGRMATVMNISMITEQEIDSLMEERS